MRCRCNFVRWSSSLVRCGSLFQRKDFIVQEHQLIGRRIKHPCNVLGILVVSHSEQLGCPFQVLLLRELRTAAKHNVQTLRCRSFQHQQPKLILNLKGMVYDGLNVLHRRFLTIERVGGC